MFSKGPPYTYKIMSYNLCSMYIHSAENVILLSFCTLMGNAIIWAMNNEKYHMSREQENVHDSTYTYIL